jgi:hypothetical protein
VALKEESMPERKNGMELAIVEPVIVCPHCKKEIRLTESLAAPLVEATRRQYEQKLAASLFFDTESQPCVLLRRLAGD